MSAARCALHERRGPFTVLVAKSATGNCCYCSLRVAAAVGGLAKLETCGYSWIMGSRVRHRSKKRRKERKKEETRVKRRKTGGTKGALDCRSIYGSGRHERRLWRKRRRQKEEANSSAGRTRQDRCYLGCTRRHYFVIGFVSMRVKAHVR